MPKLLATIALLFATIALLFALSACAPIVIVTNTPRPDVTQAPSDTPTVTTTPEEATPTREVGLPLDCDTLAVSEGFYPLNNNPCLIGRNFITLHQDVRPQCIPNGYATIWQGRDASGKLYLPPFVDCEQGGGMKLDLANRAGRFGLRFGMDNLVGNACHLLKLSVLSDINRNATIENPTRYNLDNFRFSGRLSTSGSSYSLTAQSPYTEDGYFEFVWAFHAPNDTLAIELWQEMLWADYSGNMIWDTIEVFEVGEGYCAGVTWYE